MSELKKRKWKPSGILREMKLGKIYRVQWGSCYSGFQIDKEEMICKFIQPTRCGFNLLNVKTNKCILKNHLYPNKYYCKKAQNLFLVSNRLNIEEVNYEKN